MHLLLLFYLLRWLAGSSAITGPKAVRSLERGSLTVLCRYSPGWEKHVKWWCRGAAWSSCEFVVKTTEPEKEVKKDRVSIRDNRKNRTIAVTMEKLRLNDADTYWCGIEKFGTDLGVQVKVTIDPEPCLRLQVGEQAEQCVTWSVRQAPTTVPATTPATSAINTFTVPVSLEETSDSLDATSPGSNSGSVFLKTSTLLPFISAVLLLLLMVASLVVWRMMKQQKKAAGISPEQVLQPKEDDICYTNLSLQQTENSGSSRKKASTRSSSPAQANVEEVDYVTMASFLREDIARAALSLETSDQEPTYSNMGHLITRIPSRSHEEPTEYSAIRKP
ncbi:CMRF35-like molecule 1 isoform X1 [Neophocaena asiaeorientalis asiaeorientalis]|uniref:CMRF35-like molecule 1 isoform X1 n=1 Tax=Neophocaena asiaeorientalis asiaeorientalis TaxID=1706337 RepID=A0A341CP50_NEOAA|nr:CMRF35-like molecule 1 isoform X1 [Neophocaena asiaeorientalis asiaeorientalis]XP_024616454.1 CMRF35-like molecule 1 isoform X1 [Neophocaena asiaeorientalis asiaeorientalis]